MRNPSGSPFERGPECPALESLARAGDLVSVASGVCGDFMTKLWLGVGQGTRPRVDGVRQTVRPLPPRDNVLNALRDIRPSDAISIAFRLITKRNRPKSWYSQALFPCGNLFSLEKETWILIMHPC